MSKKPRKSEDPVEKGLREVGEAAAAVGKGVENAVEAAGHAATHAVHVTAHAAGHTLGLVGKILAAPIRLPGVVKGGRREAHRLPGAEPGLESHDNLDKPPAPGQVYFRQICYGDNTVQDKTFDCVEDLLQADMAPGCKVRWINVDGLHPYVIDRMRKHFNMHTLSAEDTLHVPQRAKVEDYDDCTFIITRMLRVVDGNLFAEQVSFYVYSDTVITIQETHGDVWQPIRARINLLTSRFHSNGADFLVYALLDAIVDQCFPILEHYGDVLENLETQILARPTTKLLHRCHGVKRDLSMLRRVMWPMRDCIDVLYRDEDDCFTPNVRTYMRDVHDHAIQVIDIIETYRELASGLTDLYMSAVGNRMNEIMKVLTIIGALFIPITFIAGVYGMNFDYLPGKDYHFGWHWFWAFCGLVFVGMLVFFWRKGWLGGGDNSV